MIVMKVYGVEDTLAALNELPRVVRGRAMRIGLNAAGGMIRDSAVGFIPRRTGLSRQAIKVKVRVPELSYNRAHHARPAYAVIGASRDVVAPVIRSGGVTRKLGLKRATKFVLGGGKVRVHRPSRILHLLEKGTKPHTILAKKAGALSDGEITFGRTVKHPGSKAFAPMRRAVQTAGEAAKAKMIGKLQDGIENWASKRRARTNAQIAVGA